MAHAAVVAAQFGSLTEVIVIVMEAQLVVGGSLAWYGGSPASCGGSLASSGEDQV